MRKIFFLISVILFSLDVAASEIAIDEIIKNSRDLAAKQRYDEAIFLLNESQKKYPQNIEIKITTARILSWQGKYDIAEQKLSEINDKKNADVIFIRANIAYYKKDYQKAETLYLEILSNNPNHQDAKDALKRVGVAKKNKKISKYNWQMDAGYEHSSFSRLKFKSWSQEFLQLTSFLNNRKTALSGGIKRYDQFGKIDTEFNAAIEHVFTPSLNGYVLGSFTKSSDFRPENSVGGGGAIRIIEGKKSFMPLWLTIDSRYDVYSNTNVASNNFGIKIEPWIDWSIAAKYIAIDQKFGKRTYGKTIRIDGPLVSNTRFYLGYAKAPDTVAGIVVMTKTYFGGLGIDIGPNTILRIGYTHDDRENSYIRKVINASIGYKF